MIIDEEKRRELKLQCVFRFPWEGSIMGENSDTNLLVNIQLNYNQFTRAEKRIADYVLANASEVPFMSITELADASSVAEATINRFCRELKLKGYQDFKMQLSLAVSKREDSGLFADRQNKGHSNDLFREILEYHLSAIRETNALLDLDTVNRTVKMMTDARRILFVGVGNSMMTAQEAQGRFLHITPKSECIVDSHMQSMLASMLTSDDMIVFISYSGATSDNIHVAKMAKANGAKITVITRYPRSLLTQYADTVLICGSKESPLEGGSMGARMSQLHIIDVLFQAYYRHNLEESRINNERTAEANVDRYV